MAHMREALQFLFWIVIIWLLIDACNAIATGHNMHLPRPLRALKQKLEERIGAFIKNDSRKKEHKTGGSHG